MRAWNTVFSTVALAYGVRIVDNFHFTDSGHGEPGISGDLTLFGYTHVHTLYIHGYTHTHARTHTHTHTHTRTLIINSASLEHRVQHRGPRLRGAHC